MRVVFMGTPEFAVPALRALLDARHQVVAVVTRPDAPQGRGRVLAPSPVKAAALAHELRVLQPARVNAPESVAEIAACEPDVLVVVAFGAILKAPLLAVPRVAALNVHPSLLPALRGPAPAQRAVYAGLSWTGISVQYMSEALDAGDILLQRAEPVGAEETAGELLARLSVPSAELLVESLRALGAGSAPRVAQCHEEATFAPVLTKDDGAIDWTLDAFTLAARVRGVTPEPGARTCVAGKDVLVHRVRPLDALPGGESGVIEDVTRTDGIVVRTGKGRLAIGELQAAGRRALSGWEFARGARLSAGDRCTSSTEAAGMAPRIDAAHAARKGEHA